MYLLDKQPHDYCLIILEEHVSSSFSSFSYCGWVDCTHRCDRELCQYWGAFKFLHKDSSHILREVDHFLKDA